MKRTLALDLGTNMGWALMASGVLSSGSQSFERYKGCKSKEADHIGEPVKKLRYWLIDFIRTNKVDEIAYENVFRWNSGDAAKAYGGYRGIMLELAACGRIPVYGYSPTAIKKFWCGKGNAKKEAMVAETQKLFPDLKLTSDDEADAIAILHFHLSQ